MNDLLERTKNALVRHLEDLLDEIVEHVVNLLLRTAILFRQFEAVSQDNTIMVFQRVFLVKRLFSLTHFGCQLLGRSGLADGG